MVCFTELEGLDWNSLGDSDDGFPCSAFVYGDETALVNDPRTDPLANPHQQVAHLANTRVLEFRGGCWIFPFLVAVENIDTVGWGQLRRCCMTTGRRTGCTRRASDLEAELQQLQQKVGNETASRAVQTNPSGASFAPVGQAAQGAAFHFPTRKTKIQWDRLKGVNVHRLESETDVATLMGFLDQIQYAELESESVYRVTSANLVKLFRMSQLMLQYMGYQIHELSASRQSTHDDDAVLSRMLAGLQSASLGSILEQTGRLEESCRGLAGPGVDAAMAQARAEERQALSPIPTNQPERCASPSQPQHPGKNDDWQPSPLKPSALAKDERASSLRAGAYAGFERGEPRVRATPAADDDHAGGDYRHAANTAPRGNIGRKQLVAKYAWLKLSAVQTQGTQVESGCSQTGICESGFKDLGEESLSKQANEQEPALRQAHTMVAPVMDDGPAEQQLPPAALVDDFLVERQATVTAEHIASVRQHLTPGDAAKTTDQMISQYIRACSGDQKLAVKRIHETLAWRAEEKPATLLCPACQKDPRSHYMHPIGFDLYNRPVLYSCLQLVTNRNLEDNRKHMIFSFEQAIRMMRPGGEQWVWVSDFYGFGLVDCDPRLGKIFLDMSARHYPERLGVFLVVGPPRVFNGLWQMMQPLIDPLTKRKIIVLPYDVDKAGSSLVAALRRYFREDLVQWLLVEMRENRDKQLGKAKVYTVDSVLDPTHKLPESGHDLRGVPSFVDMVSKRPDLMLPPPAPHVSGSPVVQT
ncbi:hypothetical protein WJX72_000163 [[Myrmecia] bisecta]|uniref:CRAL-TRIO domain-containing protein n=1 Tax=[Myrmecia] bisecta TaxID=41462 RepID=A0AAW1R4X4_9CHLO